MAVTLTGADGLFTRLGRMGHVVSIVTSRLGGTAANDFPTEVEDIMEEYDTQSVTIRATVDNLPDALVTFQSNSTAFLSAVRTAAQNTLIEMVYADNPQPNRNVADSLDELIRQMKSSADDVNASAPTESVVADAGNDGDGVLIASVTNGKGELMENVYAESVLVKISTNTTAGSETATCKGEDNKATDKLAVDWPTGSGGSKTLTASNPASDGFLTNGSFDAFTTNTPDNWTIDTGAAGTDVLEETTTKYRGASALEYVGDASTLIAISQVLTTAGMLPLVPYALSFWAKVDVAPAAGTLIVDLWDGAAVIADEESTNNSLSVDLTSIGTSFVNQSAVFRLPDPLPAAITIRVRLSVAISIGSSAFIDDMILGPAMTQLYTAGPYFSLISGATNFAVGDLFTTTIGNTQGAFQKLFNQFYNLPEKQLPSDSVGGESISDTLIA